MAYFKVASDLFLGSQELNRLIKFLDDSGFRKLLLQNSLGFGLVNNSKDGEFDNFKVEQGTNPGYIRILDGIAIDADGQLITHYSEEILLTNDNQFYWIAVAHEHDEREQGLCSVDANGNLSFPGGELTKILRGVPNNPVKVKFTNATTNTSEYEILEVVDDENAALTGDFSAESNLRLSVVGAFTPDVVPPTASKYPYQYDGCNLQITLETVLNTPPTLTADRQFTLARVKRSGSTITIQDKRTEIYRSKADFNLSDIGSSDNPLIGVEAVKFNNVQTPRDQNLLFVAWGFRSSNWTIDSSTNRLTLIAGQGGKFKTTSDFTDGDFDGWRVYSKDGSYSVIKQSSLSATQINLILDTLDVDKYTDTTQQLVVVPNCEAVELILTAVAGQPQLTVLRYYAPVAVGSVQFPVTVYKTVSCQYTLKYRYQNFQTFSQETLIPDDSVSGYYTEASFNDDGTLTGTTKQTYAGGIITLAQAGNSYQTIVAGLTTGQAIGVEYIALNTAVDPVTVFIVGTRKEHVVITNDSVIETGDSDFGASYALTTNAFIDLRTDAPSTLKNGNSFVIQFRGEYTVGAYAITITQNYVNSGDTGEGLYVLTQADLDKAAEDNLLFFCTFDGTRWFVHKIISATGTSVDASRTIATTAPLTGGGNLSANRTLAINDAAADGATKGAAAFAAADFNSTAGVISIDYTNGPPPRTRALTAGSGLSGGGDLSADRTFDVNVDNSSIEISSDSLRVKADGITEAMLSDYAAVKPNGAQRYLMKFLSASWNMDTDGSVNVAHGLTESTFRSVECMILGNGGAFSPLYVGGSWASDGTNIVPFRTGGGGYDSASFNAATVYIVIFYEL